MGTRMNVMMATSVLAALCVGTANASEYVWLGTDTANPAWANGNNWQGGSATWWYDSNVTSQGNATGIASRFNWRRVARPLGSKAPLPLPGDLTHRLAVLYRHVLERFVGSV